MFIIDEIKAAHSKVKSGADFPAYIQELKKLGVIFYDTYVTDGHTDYYGNNGFKTSSAAKYASKMIAEISNKEKFQLSLLIHQQGQTDYPTFCKDAAEAGVEKWIVRLDEMTCTYYDKAGNKMLAEKIPGI